MRNEYLVALGWIVSMLLLPGCRDSRDGAPQEMKNSDSSAKKETGVRGDPGYESKRREAISDLGELVKALELFKLSTRRFPVSLDELTKPPRMGEEPILNGHPKDPWGNDYYYGLDGSTGKYDLKCLGSDGHIGGKGEAADLEPE